MNTAPLTRDQSRRVDQLAVEEYGMPSLVLMENAGRSAAEIIARRFPPAAGPIAILCGGGNNGGDGYVIGRHLHNAGYDVRCYAITSPDRLRGDAAVNHVIAARMGIVAAAYDDMHAAAAAWQHAIVIVDALLGTGFHGPVRPPLDRAIAALRAARDAGAKVIAIDVPSGLDVDTGECADPTVTADLTITFVAPKIGFDRPSARAVLGEVVIGDIGAPRELVRRIAQS